MLETPTGSGALATAITTSLQLHAFLLGWSWPTGAHHASQTSSHLIPRLPRATGCNTTRGDGLTHMLKMLSL